MSIKKILGQDIVPELLIEEMRALGIKTLSFGGISLTLSEAGVYGSPLIRPSDIPDEGKKEICSCEHPITDHNDLLQCLHGCDDELCGKEVS